MAKSLNNLTSQKRGYEEVRDGYQGFQELSNILKGYIKSAEEPEEIIEIGAKEFVADLRKLPKPMSEIRKSGYTHLIDTFAYEKNKGEHEVVVGWGKYYGRMVEHGTKPYEYTDAQPHLEPCFEKNKEKYYKLMYNEIFK